ncbi:hypothetical protein C9I36_10625 [Pectobacterium punjabense]|nr:hypothetical protein C9I36_10625 [Pectobacterium punjabense]
MKSFHFFQNKNGIYNIIYTVNFTLLILINRSFTIFTSQLILTINIFILIGFTFLLFVFKCYKRSI